MDVTSDPCGTSGCPLDPLVVIGTPTGESWPGADWGWGSQGDDYSTGDGDNWDPGTSYDGPILGFIVCVAGFVGAGFSIFDVYDSFKQLVESKQQMESAKRQYEMYIQQPVQDAAMRQLLEYEWRQAEMVYLSDVHSLSTKIYVSEASVIVAAIACGAALVTPVP